MTVEEGGLAAGALAPGTTTVVSVLAGPRDAVNAKTPITTAMTRKAMMMNVLFIERLSALSSE
ncbi:MAG: hypothetical protein ACAH95_09825 [Fimbriimonas sp.]